MKYRKAALLLAPLLAALASAQTVDWQSVQKILPGTDILVVTTNRTLCIFQTATDDKLYCFTQFMDARHPEPDVYLTFNRADIHRVYTTDVLDPSKGFVVPLFAADAGGGWGSRHQPTSFAGVKLSSLMFGVGGPVTVDLQYDRISGMNGFSVEGSGVLPLSRVPAFRPGKDHLLFKVFAEPGIGYRAGDGPFGGYASAKGLVLFGRKWAEDGGPSPYLEFQRRFPFGSPLDGDNRISVGIMFTLCDQCSLD